MNRIHMHRHLDTDDFFWMRTDPPYREERLALLRKAFGEATSWVLSGSLCGWGDSLIPEFELVVFLTVPTSVRLARLRARESERYGQRIKPEGELHDETGGVEIRSRALHEALPAGEQVARVEGSLNGLDPRLTR